MLSRPALPRGENTLRGGVPALLEGRAFAGAGDGVRVSSVRGAGAAPTTLGTSLTLRLTGLAELDGLLAEEEGRWGGCEAGLMTAVLP